MRASMDPVVDHAVSLIEVAKGHAEDAVTAGEHRARHVIESGAENAISRVDRLAGQLPTVEVGRSSKRSKSRLLAVAVALGIAVGLWAWRRKQRGAAPSMPSAEPETAMPAGDQREFRVVPKDDGGWELQGPGQVDAEYRTQATAIERARTLAQAAGGGHIVVHGLDGKPRETVNV